MGRDRMGDLRKILAAQGDRPFEDVDSEANGGGGGAGGDHRTVVVNIDTDGHFYGHPDTAFFNMVEVLRLKISELADDVHQVKIKQSNIISNPLVDAKDTRALDQLMDRIKSSSDEIKIELKGIEKKIFEHGGDVDGAEGRIRRGQHKHLLNSFKNIIEEYHGSQADYRDKCKKRLKRQIEITGANMSDKEVEDMLEEGNFAVFTQSIIMETEKARAMLADVESRHNDIIKLEKTIRDVNTLFKELAEHVELQGEVIDRIETEVAATKEYVEKGREQLVQAKQKQKSARKKKICIFGTLTIIVAIVILVIVLSV